MRTTVTLADDVAAAVENLRRDRGVGLSEALNELVRAGLAGSTKTTRKQFRQRTYDLGAGIDVSNVAEAVETLEGPLAR